MPFKPNSFFKFNVNHYDFFINLRDLHKIFYTLKGGPSLELFCKTMQTLNISADDYVYPNQNKNNSTYDQILRLLNQCNDYQLQVILATTTALLDSNPFISNVDTTNDTK